MRIAPLLVPVLVAAVAAAAVRAGHLARVPTVPCRDIIGQAKSGRDGAYRVVLGVVSVPPAYNPQVEHTGARRWPYWRKAGLVIRAGSAPVTVSVPRFWRMRAAITWGNNTPAVSALRIAPCPQPPEAWNAYAGGFLLRSHAACVPLIFSVGGRSATARFGLGRRC